MTKGNLKKVCLNFYPDADKDIPTDRTLECYVKGTFSSFDFFRVFWSILEADIAKDIDKITYLSGIDNIDIMLRGKISKKKENMLKRTIEQVCGCFSFSEIESFGRK